MPRRADTDADAETTDVSTSTSTRAWTSDVDRARDRRAVDRYARHLVLRPHGARMQRALASSRVLVVGCGGLGCPTAVYLAAAGVGVVGLADADAVEMSNLHRQVGHALDAVGTSKCASLAARCRSINDGVEIVEHEIYVTNANAEALIESYDCVCDCSDNPRTRYALSDACVSSGTPLISASCVGFEGQLTTLCATWMWSESGERMGKRRAPCYRCLFPRPPASGDAGTCGASGVLGPAPGAMGTFQAIEAIKTLSGIGESMRGKLMMFDALSARPTSTLTLRDEPDPACERCSAEADFGDVGAYDYDAFLSSTPCPARAAAAARQREGGVDLTAPPAHGSGDALDDDVARASAWSRVSARDFAATLDVGGVLVVDVRPAHAFAAARLPGSISVPIDALDERAWRDVDARSRERGDDGDVAYFICAGGVNSQRAAEWFSKLPEDARRGRRARDVRGGFASWRRDVDPTFPKLN